jgi:PST family polysaccharide transporter
MSGAPTRSRIAANGFMWSGLGLGAQALCQLLLLVVLARELTPADFGVVQAVLVVIGLGRMFTESIVGPALVQKPAISDRLVRTGATIAVLSGLFTAALLFVTAPALAGLFGAERFVPVIRVLQLSFVIQAVGVVSEALLQRELRFRSIAQANACSFVIGYAAVGAVLGIGGAGVWALVAANLGQLLVYTTLLVVAHPVSMRPTIDRRCAGELMYYGGGFTLGRFFNYAALQGDYVVVGSMLSPAALGIYGRAYQLLASPAMLLGQVLDRVLFPMLAEIQQDRVRLARQYRRAVSLVAMVMLPVTAFVLVLAPQIVAVTLGDRWEGVVTPLRLLSLSLLARTSYKVSDSLARAAGLVYARAVRQLAYAVLVIVGAVIGQRWGVSGVAAGVALAVVANFGLMANLSLKATGITVSSFAAAHRRGAVLGVAVAAIVGPVVLLAERSGASDVVTLAAACASVAIAALPMLRSHAVLLGPDVAWLTASLRPVRSPAARPAPIGADR